MAIYPPKKNSLYNRNAVRQLFSYAPANKQKLEEQLDFNVDYIQSPMYKSRLEKIISTDVDSKGNFLNPLAKQVGAKKGEKVSEISNRIINMQLNNINKSDYYTSDVLPQGIMGINQDYRDKNGKLINQSTVVKTEAINTETPAHEFSHASVGNTQPYSKSFENKIVSKHIKNKPPKGWSQDFFDYMKIPTELKAKVDAARYILKKAGIYDAGKETFNMSHYKKMLEYDSGELGKDNAGSINFLKSMSSSDENGNTQSDKQKVENFIWLMNNIAKNKSNTDNSGLA